MQFYCHPINCSVPNESFIFQPPCCDNVIYPENFYSGLRVDKYHPPIGLRTYWWGWTLALDNTATQDLADVITMGGGAAAIAGALLAAGIATIPASVVFGVIAGATAIGVGGINLLNRHSGYKGIYFTGIWLPGSYPAVHARY